MDKVSAGRPYTFQQDSAPAHTAKKTLELLKFKVPNFWRPNTWPSNSPDLNPCDFYLWGRVEGIACVKPHASVAPLKSSIKKAMNNLDQREVSSAVCSFRRRVEYVVANGGAHYE
jgi:hypothetical protein